nr:chaperone modulator CbpM [Nitrospinota bacterium]
LVSPQRTPGNTRMYSRRDIERLQTILNLTREMGVNLAGVQVILNLLDRMEDQQGRMEEMKEFIRQEMWTLLKEKYGETSTALTPVDHQGVVPFRRKRP